MERMRMGEYWCHRHDARFMQSRDIIQPSLSCYYCICERRTHTHISSTAFKGAASSGQTDGRRERESGESRIAQRNEKLKLHLCVVGLFLFLLMMTTSPSHVFCIIIIIAIRSSRHDLRSTYCGGPVHACLLRFCIPIHAPQNTWWYLYVCSIVVAIHFHLRKAMGHICSHKSYSMRYTISSLE